MLGQGVHRFNGDLVLADSHYMPFKKHSFDALAFITTFEYYKNPIQVIQEAARVGKYGIIFGMMNRNSPKLIRRRVQQTFGKNPFYVTATFYTPGSLRSIIDTALKVGIIPLAGKQLACPSGFPCRNGI